MPARRSACTPSVAALQSARLGLLRQGRVRHRHRRFQRRAADRAAERHHLPQPRQRLARQGRIRQGDRRLRSGDQARTADRRFPGRTAAFRNRRSAISTARWPTSTRRSGSTRHCRSRLINRAVIWRAKGDLDRAIADATEAIRLAKAKAPANIMTPPGSVLISAYIQRAPRLRGQGRFRPRQAGLCRHARRRQASDAGSKANQATAKVRLSLLSETLPPAPRTATAAPPPPASKAAPASRRARRARPRLPRRNAQARRDRQRNRQARRAGDRQRRLHGRLATTDSEQRARADRREPAHHRLRDDRGHRSRPRGEQATPRDFLLDAARRRSRWSTTRARRADRRPERPGAMESMRAGSGRTEAMMDSIHHGGPRRQLRTNILTRCLPRRSLRGHDRGNRPTPPASLTVRSGLAPQSGLSTGRRGAWVPKHSEAFATAPGQVALDGDGRNSPFSAALGRHVTTPGLELQQKMLTRVRSEVVAATEGNGSVVELLAARRGLPDGEMTVRSHTVIPGWCAAPDPESRDSGFDASHRPGMTCL